MIPHAKGVALFAALLVWSLDAAGEVRFVSPDGVDQGQCLVATSPCASVQYAIDQALSGDTVRLALGRYTGHVVVPNTLTSLSIEGGWVREFEAGSRQVAPGGTVIDGDGAENVLRVEDCAASMDLSVTGLTLTNGDVGLLMTAECWSAGSQGPAVFHVSDCLISGCERGVELVTVEWAGQPVTAVITNAIIQDNAPWGGIMAHSDPLVRADLVLHSSTVTGNGSVDLGGVVLSAWGSSSGASDLNATVVNSIIWGNRGPDVLLSARPHPASMLDLDALHSDLGSVVVEWGNYNPVSVISLDPLFPYPGASHLTRGSPCVDSGAPDSAPATDVDGDSRPLGGGYDMGADEYGPTIFTDGWQSSDLSRWALCVGGSRPPRGT